MNSHEKFYKNFRAVDNFQRYKRRGGRIKFSRTEKPNNYAGFAGQNPTPKRQPAIAKTRAETN